MSKKLKFFFGVSYLIILVIFLYFIFSQVEISKLNDFLYYKEIQITLENYIGGDLFFNLVLFFIFSVVWILLLGFGSPLLIISGVLFGKFYGTLISVLGFTFGCTLLYILANQYFKDIILEKLSTKISKFKDMFNRNEFLYFMIFRFAGGGGTPFAIQNLLPVIFNMKIKNYFFSTLFGLFPTVFIISAIGEGLEKIIENNIEPSFVEMIQNKDILFPILGFFAIIIFSFILRKIYFKK